VVALGSVDISVCSEPNIDPYFSNPLPDPPVKRQKAWFLLMNIANMLLPAFMGGHPIPHPNWKYGVVWANLHRLQPLLEIVQGLLQRGLMGEEILWTFSNCGVQPLCQQEVNVRVFLGPSCPIRPSFMKLGSAKKNTRVWGLLRAWRGGRPTVSVVNDCCRRG
jgi:hypothetical protein